MFASLPPWTARRRGTSSLVPTARHPHLVRPAFVCTSAPTLTRCTRQLQRPPSLFTRHRTGQGGLGRLHRRRLPQLRRRSARCCCPRRHRRAQEPCASLYLAPHCPKLTCICSQSSFPRRLSMLTRTRRFASVCRPSTRARGYRQQASRTASRSASSKGACGLSRRCSAPSDPTTNPTGKSSPIRHSSSRNSARPSSRSSSARPRAAHQRRRPR